MIPRLGLPLPPSSIPDLVTWLASLARSLQEYDVQVATAFSAVILQLVRRTTADELPEPQGDDSIFLITDTRTLVYDNGDEWVDIGKLPDAIIVAENAPGQSLVIDGGGNVNINGDLEVSGSCATEGISLGSWNVDGESELAIKHDDVRVVAVERDAIEDAIRVTSSGILGKGWIGLNIDQPEAPLHIADGQPDLLRLSNAGNTKITLENTASGGHTWVINNASSLRLAGDGPVTAQVVIDLIGNVTIQGRLSCAVEDVGMVSRAATQNISSGSPTFISFDAEDYDPQGYIDLGSDAQSITVPAGVWIITAHVEWASLTGGYREAAIQVGGVFETKNVVEPCSTTGNQHSLSVISRTTGTANIKLRVYQTSGSSLNVLSANLRAARLV